MTKCKCGCDGEAKEGKEFIAGHYSKWKSQQNKTLQSHSDTAGVFSQKKPLVPSVTPSTPNQTPAADTNKRSFLDVVLHRNTKPKEEKKPSVITIEEMLTKLPRWAIKEHKPWFAGENKKRRLIQFVGVSKIKPPVMCWLYWDGVFISMEDGLYQPPHDIRGNVFFYDLDNSKPLLDNVKEDEETHESLRMAQVKNIAYSMGRIAGAQDLLKNLGLILMGILFLVLLCLANLYFSYQMTQGFAAANDQIGNITRAVNTYIDTHP